MTKPHRPDCRRRGFTLIELLIVVAIIAILAAAAVPVAGMVKENADSSRSLANLRQIGSALTAYAADNGHYPVIDGGDSQIEEVPFWVAELIVQLNPNDTVEDLAESMPTDIFVSPGLRWGDGSGSGSYFDQSEIICTYAATDCMVGLDYDFRLDPSRGRRADSIERKTESILLVEAQQEGSNPYCPEHVAWSEARRDLEVADAKDASSLDFRYRDRLNALMADMSAVNLGGPKKTEDIVRANWQGHEYRDR